MHETLWFTKLLNYLFASQVNGFLGALGIHPHNPAEPIPNYMAMQVLVALILVAMVLFLRSQLSLDRPGKLQHILEVAYGLMRGQAEEIIGHHGPRFIPMVMTLGLFILFCNLVGLVPTFGAATSHIEVTVGCAMVAFIYYHYAGIRQQGLFKYLKHFSGPILVLAPLMIVVEFFSHLARPLSLSVRLFANIFAGHQVAEVFFDLSKGIVIPMVFYGLDTFISFLQAYIFMLLTMVYLSGAVAEEH